MTNPFATFGDFVPIWPWIAKIEGVTLHDAFLLGLLARFRGGADDGECFPSIPTLARELGVDKRDVQRRLRRLEDAGVLVREERSGTSSVYRFCDPRVNDPRVLAPLGDDPMGASAARGTASEPTPGTGPEPTPPMGRHTAQQDLLKDERTRSSDKRESARGARDRTRNAARPQRRFPDFVPSAKHEQLAQTLGVDLQFELAKFRDHEYPKAKSDPDATFSNWLRNASTFGRKPKAARVPLRVVTGGARRTERDYLADETEVPRA
jgi:hypothetical protein